jgi:FkbH-like protein
MIHLSEEQQRRLFGEDFSRACLRGSDVSHGARISLGVRRNWVVEPAMTLVRRICAEVGIDLETRIGPYDESFSLPSTNDGPRTQLIWPDWNRAWELAQGRFPRHVLDVRNIGGERSLLVSPFREDAAWSQFMRHVLAAELPPNVQPVLVGHLQTPHLRRDASLVAKYGTDLPNKLVLLAARSVALQGIAPLLHKVGKVLAVDFDNTLYDGVLGEEGLTGIRFSDGHRLLWQVLEDLRSRGVLLTANSKNDVADVQDLLDSGALHPLTRESFVDYRVSWQPKLEGLRESANKLGLGLDSFVLLDDNPAERLLAQESGHGIRTIDGSDPRVAAEVLRNGPNFPVLDDQLAAGRERDIRAQEARRQTLGDEGPSTEFHQRLGTSISTWRARAEDVVRVAQLFSKTNQMNVSLRRTTATELAQLLEQPGTRLGVASVLDRYADSGLVAAVLARHGGPEVEVLEFVVSCRVLGRGLESVLFWGMLTAALGSSDVQTLPTIRVNYSAGPRNEPALTWLQNETHEALEEFGSVLLSPPSSRLMSGLFHLIQGQDEVMLKND